MQLTSPHMQQPFLAVCLFLGITAPLTAPHTAPLTADHVQQLQREAIAHGRASWAHWGWEPNNYLRWASHTNRLIPVYTYGTRGQGEGIDVRSYTGERSLYRSARRLVRLYGRIPEGTLNEAADYMDQTNIFDIQLAGLQSRKKYIFLVVFDGMDWETTRAAAIYNSGRVAYQSGRGTGTHFQDYRASGTSQFGLMVTSPYSSAVAVDVNRQVLLRRENLLGGGYDAARGGRAPWVAGADPRYLVGQSPANGQHAVTGSASSATSMTAGVKTYNTAVLVNPAGDRLASIAHRAQSMGYAVGAVTSVPIGHATPAATYAHNVHRNDYQDLTRDLLGLPSVSHPTRALSGLDVLIGGGHGVIRAEDEAQGLNFVPGNAYLTDEDLRSVNVENGGRYVVAQRSSEMPGGQTLSQSAAQAAIDGHRLLGFYGVGGEARGHLPYATSDGDYQPVAGRSKSAETYLPSDIIENPTLAEMTDAALTVLTTRPQGFWLMVEAGDVDWANHDNNLDNAIGAVNSGDQAVAVLTKWVEQHSNWNESLMVVTADHGHYLVLARPELLVKQRDDGH